MSTIAKKLKAIADSKEAIRKKLFISPEVPLSAYAELVPGSPAVVKPDQSTFDSVLPFGRMKLLEASKEALRVGLGLSVAVPFSAYAEKVAAPAYAGDFLTGNFRKNDVEVAFEEVAEFTRLSEATDFVEGELVEYVEGEVRLKEGNGLLMEPESTNTLSRSNPFNVFFLSSPPFAMGSEEHVYAAEEGISGLPTLSVSLSKPGFLNLRTSSTAFAMEGQSPSVVLKSNLRYCRVISSSTSVYAIYDLLNAEVISARIPGATPSIVPVGGGWSRLSMVSYGRGAGYYNMVEVSDTLVFRSSSSLQGVQDYLKLSAVQKESTGDLYPFSSYIPTTGALATRAPDILRVPLPAGHTLTLDADEGIKAERDGDFAVITADKPGYLRRFAVGPVRRSTMNFTKGEYKEGNFTVELSRLAEFTRLSGATELTPELLMVDADSSVLRLKDGKGLLMEPESTNYRLNYLARPNAVYPDTFEAMDDITGVSRTIRMTSRVNGASRFEQTYNNLPNGQEFCVSYYTMSDKGHSNCLDARSWLNVSGLPSSGSGELKSTESQVLGVSAAGETISRQFSLATQVTAPVTLRWYFLNPVYSLGVTAWQIELRSSPTSVIVTGLVPATRAPDILRVPVSATQTLTYDADPSISMEMDGTTAVFTATEPGYIRSITLTEK